MNALRALFVPLRRLARRVGPHAGQRLNAGTHLAGVALGLASIPFLLRRCQHAGDALAVGGAAVFAATALLLFCASVFCHASRSHSLRMRGCLFSLFLFLFIH